ncbi:hypothetical protein QUA35_06620 [Microcoleus sp. N9_B2]|uniref:hypothetical protein n=1 Tax=unclassified Microcoleus TaxID=2642155 RepID=UPI002FD23DD7
MYTLEQLQQKNLKELKKIGWQLNVLPEGDKRCRQNWIDALVGIQPPLLKLLETSPGVVHEAPNTMHEAPNTMHEAPMESADSIEVQRQEPPIESKFGRITYPKPAAKPIAQNAETRLQLDRTQSADVHNGRSHSAESVRDSDGAEAEALGSEKGDRVLAVAGNCEAIRGGILPHQPVKLDFTEADRPPNRGDNGRDRLEIDPKLSQSAIELAAKTSPGVKLSNRFLATYPPYFGDVNYKAEATGQLNLLESVEADDEPPDPDDFESLDVFREAIALWDAKHLELIEIGLDSFCEWAPCPDDWYESDTLLEPSEVLEHSIAGKSSSTCEFLIPVFDDRPRQIDSDEPPDTGIFARLPKPKPPSFPPMGVVAGDRANSIRKFARGAIFLSGRDPPGGDAMH